MDEGKVCGIAARFEIDGEPFFSEPFGHGHINATHAVYFKFEDRRPYRAIVQQVNTNVFRDPYALMENIVAVTSFLKQKTVAAGGDPWREVLTPIPAKGGGYLYRDGEGRFWRAYVFIDDAATHQEGATPRLFYSAAKAFGRFQRLLADFPAETLHETIPAFHDTGKRYADFARAVAEDAAGRAAAVREEIDFVHARRGEYGYITGMLASGEIPLRVTHNDTKLNNVMIDNRTGEGLCVIDLDTVMPGSALYDFGDSIRFGANTAAEDERDLKKVGFSMELYETYARGFLSEARLTPAETGNLHWGAKMMTMENGMRFLEDYLRGDVYFRTARPGHNLDRARTQFRLAEEMEAKFGDMRAVSLECGGSA